MSEQRAVVGLPAESLFGKETIPFRATIPALWDGYLVAIPAAPATIEHIAVRIYPGPEQSVRVRPVLYRNRFEEALFRYGLLGPVSGATVKTYIDGDSDIWGFDLCRPVGPHDEIRIYMQNLALVIAYDVACDVTLDYAGGRYPAAIAPFRDAGGGAS